MQLDTETAAAILKSSAQCNAVAEEATRRVVELMQDGIEYRERIAELETACRIALDAYGRVSNVALPGDVAGGLVHARETLRRALGDL